MRIAVLADIHGNLPALRAVLADVDHRRVDAIVVGGDTAAGPLVQESLELLAGRPEPLHWLRGNGERELVACSSGGRAQPDASDWVRWSAARVDDRWRARMASWPFALELGGICFCHGSPRADDEILTRGTPAEVMSEAVADTPARLIVGGHTHQQFVRELPDGRVVANAGSVGLPYEGRAAAFWMIVADGRPELRTTSYDVPAALAELRASGLQELDDGVRESLLEPADPEWVTAYFEHQAGRGDAPASPPPAA